MRTFLPHLAKEKDKQQVDLTLENRLPEHVSTPAVLHCEYYAERLDEQCYLLTFQVTGEVEILCHRCLQPFNYHYENESQLAICEDEEAAERLMSEYECMVSENYWVDMIDVLTDDLYLYTPEKHPEISDCDRDMSVFINKDVPE